MKKKVLAVTATAAIAGAAIGGGAWLAFGADAETAERGACAGSAYELSVGDDDGGLELEYELQSTSPGEVWNVVVTHGDAVLFAADRTTDEDGELDLDTLVDPDGATVFTVTATPTQGDPCVASVTR